MDQERFDRIRLARSEGIGPAGYRQALRRFGSAGGALRALPDLVRRGSSRPLVPADERLIAREVERAAVLASCDAPDNAVEGKPFSKIALNFFYRRQKEKDWITFLYNEEDNTLGRTQDGKQFMTKTPLSGRSRSSRSAAAASSTVSSSTVIRGYPASSVIFFPWAQLRLS